jgi:hypothetical protein
MAWADRKTVTGYGPHYYQPPRSFADFLGRHKPYRVDLATDCGRSYVCVTTLSIPRRIRQTKAVRGTFYAMTFGPIPRRYSDEEIAAFEVEAQLLLALG